MITLRELGPAGLKGKIEAQNLKEMIPAAANASTDLSGVPLPSALGIGGAIPRKTDAAQRVMIDQELHASLIIAEIWRLYNTDDGRRNNAKHVDVTKNVLQRTANALSVVYDRPPVRTFEAGAEAMEKAWSSAVIDRAQYNGHAALWARYAFITNVVHVIPQVFEGELVFEEVLPHAADVVFGPGERQPSILVYRSDGASWTRVAVDSERYWYLDDQWAVVHQWVHGYKDLQGNPMRPWIQWRTKQRLSSMDYWLRGVGRQLVDATLKVGVVNAAMSEVRQNGNSMQKVLTAQNIDEDVPAGQTVNSEVPLILRAGTFDVKSLIVPVQEFHLQMDGDIEAIAESYGVPRGAIDSSKRTEDGWAEHVAVSRERERQMPQLRAADLETEIKSAIIMQADGHPDAGALDPRQVAETRRLVYQGHTFLERPKDRMEFYALERSQGLASHVDQRMREHPGEDRPTATAAVDSTIEERNRVSALLAEHNLPGDAGQDGDDLAQLQGRLGGMSRPDPDGNEDE